MAYSHLLPFVSPTSGDREDGELIGSVLESDFTGCFSDVRLAGAVFAYRKDVSGNTFTFDDLSTALNSDATGDAQPFGSTAQMGAGDLLYIACDHRIKHLYFKVSTAGAWTGTVAFKCSTDGVSANHTLTVTDDSNGFRAGTGVYRMQFTLPSNITSFSPVPGSVASRMWIVMEPSVSGTPTTAPVLSQAWAEHEDGDLVYTNLSTLINQDILGPSGSGHSATFFPTVGSSVYIAYQNVPKGMKREVYQRRANIRTRVYEYLAADNTWKTLTGATDPSNDYLNGPSTLTQKTITGATQANQCVLTISAHGFSVGDMIHIHDVVGMTGLNQLTARITATTTNSVTINVDSSGFSAYTSGGVATLCNVYNVNIQAATDWVSKSQTFVTNPNLTYFIEPVTRVNAITSASVTVKRIKPSIDGVPVLHHYVFDGAVTDVAAKAAIKADLEGPKGYGALTEI